jgi:hypothetical protein
MLHAFGNARLQLSPKLFDVQARDRLVPPRTEIRQEIAVEHRLVVSARRGAQSYLALQPLLRNLSKRESASNPRIRACVHFAEPFLKQLSDSSLLERADQAKLITPTGL